MNTQLCETSFTLKANGKIANTIASAYKAKAIHSIQHVACAVQKTIGVDQSSVLELLNLLKDYSASSKFYIFNSQLIRHLTINRDMDMVIATLADLAVTPLTQLIHSEYKINNLGAVSWSDEFSTDTIKDANSIFGVGYAEINPVDAALLPKHHEIISHSLSMLKSSCAHDFHDEVTHYVSDIILFNGRGVTGGSSTRMMGSIFIRIHDKANMDDYYKNELALSYLTPEIYYLEQIVHETAHLHLDQLMEFDPLVLNDPAERYDSPIRKDKRPMRGVFHATFVLARLYQLFTMTQFYQADKQSSQAMRIPPLHKALLKGIDILKANAKFTPLGTRIFDEMTLASRREYAHAA